MTTESVMQIEDVELRPGEFLDDISDAELVSGKFLKKEVFEDGGTVVLLGIERSRFQDKNPKYDLHMEIEGEEKVLTITGQYVQMLKDIFGKPAMWYKKACHIKAVPGEFLINGATKVGYTLEFKKV